MRETDWGIVQWWNSSLEYFAHMGLWAQFPELHTNRCHDLNGSKNLKLQIHFLVQCGKKQPEKIRCILQQGSLLSTPIPVQLFIIIDSWYCLSSCISAISSYKLFLEQINILKYKERSDKLILYIFILPLESILYITTVTYMCFVHSLCGTNGFHS